MFVSNAEVREAAEEVRKVVQQFADTCDLTFNEAMEVIIEGHANYLKTERAKNCCAVCRTTLTIDGRCIVCDV